MCARAALSRVLAFGVAKSMFQVTSLRVEGNDESNIAFAALEVRRHVLCLEEYRVASTDMSFRSELTISFDRDGMK